MGSAWSAVASYCPDSLSLKVSSAYSRKRKRDSSEDEEMKLNAFLSSPKKLVDFCGNFNLRVKSAISCPGTRVGRVVEYYDDYGHLLDPSVTSLIILLREYIVCFDEIHRKKLTCTAMYIYQALFVEGKDSDITVSVLNSEWKLHKVYLGQVRLFPSIMLPVEVNNVVIESNDVNSGVFYRVSISTVCFLVRGMKPRKTTLPSGLKMNASQLMVKF